MDHTLGLSLPMSAACPPRDPRFATTLAHGLALLEAFDATHAGLTNKELAERSGLSKATVSRLSLTLQAHGLLECGPGERRHRLASAALTLGYPLLAGLGIRREARWGMKQLADELGGSVSLGLRERARMIYVETSRSSNPMAFCPDVGAALPMLQTAMGRAWLAAAPEALRREVLALLRRHLPAAWAQWCGSVGPAIEHLQRHGFCVSHADWQSDVYAVAVPLNAPADAEPVVINCGVPIRSLRPGELQSRVAPRLMALARRIEAHWRAATQPAMPVALPLEVAHGAVSGTVSHAHTLSRGLDLLQCFRPGEVQLGHAELTRRLRLPGPIVVRLTHTLGALGYLRRGAAGSGYRLGAATVALGYPLLAHLRARQLARPGMMALSERVGGAVSLGFRHRSSMVYVESAWRGDARLVPPDIGTPLPMLSSAMGRAWLAHASAAQRCAVLNQLRVQDPASHARYAPDIEQARQDLARKAYCSTRGDVRKDVYAFAVPFSRPVDGLQLVMNCGVLAARFSFAQAERQVAQPLCELVRQVEAALGLRAAQ